MQTMLYFTTLFLVACLTLCLSEYHKENDEDEFLEEILDMERRDAMPQPRGKKFIFQFFNHAKKELRIHRMKRYINYGIALPETTDTDVHNCPPVVYYLGVLKHLRPKKSHK